MLFFISKLIFKESLPNEDTLPKPVALNPRVLRDSAKKEESPLPLKNNEEVLKTGKKTEQTPQAEAQPKTEPKTELKTESKTGESSKQKFLVNFRYTLDSYTKKNSIIKDTPKQKILIPMEELDVFINCIKNEQPKLFDVVNPKLDLYLVEENENVKKMSLEEKTTYIFQDQNIKSSISLINYNLYHFHHLTSDSIHELPNNKDTIYNYANTNIANGRKLNKNINNLLEQLTKIPLSSSVLTLSEKDINILWNYYDHLDKILNLMTSSQSLKINNKKFVDEVLLRDINKEIDKYLQNNKINKQQIQLDISYNQLLIISDFFAHDIFKRDLYRFIDSNTILQEKLEESYSFIRNLTNKYTTFYTLADFFYYNWKRTYKGQILNEVVDLYHLRNFQHKIWLLTPIYENINDHCVERVSIFLSSSEQLTSIFEEKAKISNTKSGLKFILPLIGFILFSLLVTFSFNQQIENSLFSFNEQLKNLSLLINDQEKKLKEFFHQNPINQKETTNTEDKLNDTYLADIKYINNIKQYYGIVNQKILDNSVTTSNELKQTVSKCMKDIRKEINSQYNNDLLESVNTIKTSTQIIQETVSSINAVTRIQSRMGSFEEDNIKVYNLQTLLGGVVTHYSIIFVINITTKLLCNSNHLNSYDSLLIDSVRNIINSAINISIYCNILEPNLPIYMNNIILGQKDIIGIILTSQLTLVEYTMKAFGLKTNTLSKLDDCIKRENITSRVSTLWFSIGLPTFICKKILQQFPSFLNLPVVGSLSKKILNITTAGTGTGTGTETGTAAASAATAAAGALAGTTAGVPPATDSTSAVYRELIALINGNNLYTNITLTFVSLGGVYMIYKLREMHLKQIEIHSKQIEMHAKQIKIEKLCTKTDDDSNSNDDTTQQQTNKKYNLLGKTESR